MSTHGPRDTSPALRSALRARRSAGIASRARIVLVSGSVVALSAACGGQARDEPPPSTAAHEPPPAASSIGEDRDASPIASRPPATPAMPASCDGKSAAATCWRIAKAGGAEAKRASDALRAVCKDRGTIETCAATLDLLGSTLPEEEAKKAAHEACNESVSLEGGALAQAGACMRNGASLEARGTKFLALDAYDNGCALGLPAACDAVKRVHAALAAEGRDLANVQFPMGGIRYDDAYRLDDVGCHLLASTDLQTYFSELAAPFAKKRKALVACLGVDGSAPLAWRAAGGKIAEVHAHGASAAASACLERVLRGTPSKVEVECGGVLMNGAPARARVEAERRE